MTQDRLKQAMNIFSRVADVDPSERSRLLDEACGSDTLLRRKWNHCCVTIRRRH